MRKINPVIPLPVLIVLFAIAALVILIIWIRSKENRIKSTFEFFIRLGIAALAFVIALRPMREERGIDVPLGNLDVLFVLDTTLSMWADDGPVTTRFAAAQKDVEGIMNDLAGANFALITFQNKSVVLSPFTQDKDTVTGLLNNIQTPVVNGDDSYGLTGSRMETPYYDLQSLLISSNKKENRQTIVFFLSDGEVTHPENSAYDYAQLGDLVDGGAVIGYGTETGGQMQDKYTFTVYDDNSTFSLHGTSGNAPAVSCIDEDNLRNIAYGLGVEYIHRDNGTNLAPVTDKIKATSATVTERRNDIVNYYDTHYKYVPLLAVLLAIELVIRIRENAIVLKKHGKKTKKQKTI
ncbi:MAG: VWA domain-containing protein [Lachnospiraceae bacterium]|nr:VWA domain-containing protein [Lachnospiraceae bacterium]